MELVKNIARWVVALWLVGVVGFIGFRGVRTLVEYWSEPAGSAPRSELAKVRIELDSLREEIKRVKNGNDMPVCPTASYWIDVQRQARNAVVQVFTTILAFDWAEPYRVPEQGEGRGSGFFIDADGNFLTNYHVVAQGLRVQVQVPALGEERLDADVVGVSPERDLALVRLSDKGCEMLRDALGSIPYLTLGSSDAVQRGQETMALGYPLGMEHLKSTQGIVSGWERVSFSERGFGQLCFQITTPINPGSSGGPSLNSAGQVIGINFAGAVAAQNVGYVIPIDDVKSAIKDLHHVKLLRKPRLGAGFLQISRSMSKYLKAPDGGGLYVARVTKGSLFEKIGVKEGDLVREIDGHLLDYQGNINVSWSDDKVSGLDLLNRLVVGDKISFVMYRNGNRLEFKFELEKAPVPSIRMVYPDYEETDYELFAGLSIMELTLNHIGLFGEKNIELLKYVSEEHQFDQALIVTNVLPTSEMYNLPRNITPGTLIEAVNGRKVTTLKELREAIKEGLSSPFLTVTSEDKRFVVLATDKVLSDEKRLVGLFRYDPAHSVVLRQVLNGK